MDAKERANKTNALMNLLPYPRTWFDSLNDKRLNAIYRRHLPKMIEHTFEKDEQQVRLRAGLPPQSVQLSFNF